MPIYHGRDGAIYASTSATGDRLATCSTMTAWTMDRCSRTGGRDQLRLDEPGGAAGLARAARDVRGVLEHGRNETVRRRHRPRTGCKLYLYPTRRVPSKYIACMAWLDASIETRVDGVTRVRGTYSAFGAGAVINL